MSVMDKVNKMRRTRTTFGDRSSTRGIFFTWQDGDNVIRLVGEFIEVRTHFIAPNKRRGERGLCMESAFTDAENKMPQVVNCPDWDIDTEEVKKERTCVICALNEYAQKKLKDTSLPKDEKDRLQNLLQATRARRSLKWNIIDRANPYVTEVTDDGEKKVLGYKIATIGMEAWNDIDGIFAQTAFDITDPEKGINICVTKSNNGHRVTYGAKAVLKGTSVDVAPLSDDEKELRLHDLKKICGKMTEQDRLMEALHADYREVVEKLGLSKESSASEEDSSDEPEEPVEKEESAKEEPAEEEEPVADEDEDFPDTSLDDDEPEETSEETESESKDSSDEKEEVAPENWECFGSLDPKHPECKECSGIEKCRVETEKRKKGK